MIVRPSEELRIGSFVMRPTHDVDVEVYTEAQRASHAHLAQYEGWAQPVPTLAASELWVGYCRTQWQAGTGFTYCTYDALTGDLVGSVGTHPLAADPQGASIGYWTLEHRTGSGAATLGTAALVVAVLNLGVLDRLEIHHDVNNTISARIPRRLGFQQTEARPRPRTAPGEAGHELVWRIERRWFQKTYAHRLWVEEHH
ncbi:MAG: GNAT family N-acetyltransferase [Acidimicrobiia bacterium]|nr:GNAT family N-acetyltransferase [Acidimicrobiia bacterium]